MVRGGGLIGVEWGDEYHELVLGPEDWQRVKAGHALQVKGEGYAYEGEFFQDVWTFAGGLDGDLTVTCAEGKDEGVGLEGMPSEPDIGGDFSGGTNGWPTPRERRRQRRRDA